MLPVYFSKNELVREKIDIVSYARHHIYTNPKKREKSDRTK